MYMSAANELRSMCPPCWPVGRFTVSAAFYGGVGGTQGGLRRAKGVVLSAANVRWEEVSVHTHAPAPMHR
jgi:hypothetical protein